MKYLVFLPVLLLALLGANNYENIQLTHREQEALNELNKVRTAPQLYIPLIENYVDSLTKLHSNPKASGIPLNIDEIRKAATELIMELTVLEPLPAVSLKECLCISARKHGEWLQNNNTHGHKGEGNSNCAERITAACGEAKQASIIWSENIYKGPATPRQVNIELLLDVGIADRGHRKTILSEQLTCAGVGEVMINIGTDATTSHSYWVFNFSNY